jgi:tetratricopeptide (TPR) repeat protein
MRWSCARAAVSAWAAAACLAAVDPAAAQTSRVVGRVRDAETGKPIRGATVVAENPEAAPSSYTAASDEKGNFAIIGLKTGRWTFTASAPGYRAQTGVMPVRMLSANPPVEFRLARDVAVPRLPLEGVDGRALDARLVRAGELLAAGDHEAAIAEYEAIRAATPALTMVDLAIGRAWRARREYARAMAAFRRLLESASAGPGSEAAKAARLEIALTLIEQGDLAAAESELAALVELPSAPREAFYHLAEVKVARQQADEAVRWYEAAAERDPAWVLPRFKLGLLAAGRGDRAGAVAHLEKAVAIDPASPEAARARDLLDQIRR